MPCDGPSRLLQWKVPSVRQRYTRRDTALYALSVGLGHDPLDPRQLSMVDPWNERLAALPSMALVLGYPGFWLGDPKVHAATGIAADQVLHAEQSLELHAPVPAEAEVVGHTRVVGLVDKGAGRSALLYSERTIQHAGDAKRIATCRQVHHLRGAGGFGDTGFAAPPAAAIPAGEPDMTADLSTRPEQALLYRLNGDANAIHFDPAVSRRAGFARPLLHGMCTMGLVVHALLRTLVDYDATRMRSLTLRMTAPVLPGDTIRTEVWRNGMFRARVPERDVLVVNNGQLVTA
jgi:acyl dehydratase